MQIAPIAPVRLAAPATAAPATAAPVAPRPLDEPKPLPTREQLAEGYKQLTAGVGFLTMKAAMSPTAGSAMATDIDKFTGIWNDLVGASRAVAPELETTWVQVEQAGTTLRTLADSLRAQTTPVDVASFGAALQPIATVLGAAYTALTTPAPAA